MAMKLPAAVRCLYRMHDGQDLAITSFEMKRLPPSELEQEAVPSLLHGLFGGWALLPDTPSQCVHACTGIHADMRANACTHARTLIGVLIGTSVADQDPLRASTILHSLFHEMTYWGSKYEILAQIRFHDAGKLLVDHFMLDNVCYNCSGGEDIYTRLSWQKIRPANSWRLDWA